MQNEINERENEVRTGTDDCLERSIFHFHIVRWFRRALCLATLPLNTLPRRSHWVNEWKLIIMVFRCSATASHANTQKNEFDAGSKANTQFCAWNFLECFFINVWRWAYAISNNCGILSAKKGETIVLNSSVEQNKLIAKQRAPCYGIFFSLLFRSTHIISSFFFFFFRCAVYTFGNIDIQFIVNEVLKSEAILFVLLEFNFFIAF